MAGDRIAEASGSQEPEASGASAPPPDQAARPRTPPALREEPLEVGRAFSDALRALRRYPSLVLGAMAVLLPAGVLQFAPVLELGISWHTAGRIGTNDSFWPELVLNTVASAVVLAAGVGALRGRVGWGPALMRLPVLLFRVVAIELCVVVGVLAGALLLIVPGIIVLVAFSLAEPLAAVDGLGVLDSLEHSWMLSRGHRWRLFAVMLGLLVGYGLGALVFATISVGAGFMNMSAEGWVAMQAVCTVGYIFVDAFYLVFSTLVFLAFHAQLKEPSAPVDAVAVAEVFA